MEGENRLYTSLSIAGGFFCLAAALFFGSAPAAAAAALFFFLSLALWRYGNVLVPVLASWSRIVEVGKGYEIPPSQDVVVGSVGGRFLATAFLSARIYDSPSQKDDKAKTASLLMFEKAISSAGFPFKACMQVCRLDLASELEEVKTRRSVAEAKRAQLDSSPKHDPERTRYEREIAMWSRLAERMGEGEMPLEVVFYFSTTAEGRTKEEAIARARSQADELSVMLSSALSCEVSRLKGEEMKRCFAWDFFGPTSAEEMRDAMF
ncbi:MAG: hypothetical protein N3F07_00610 [Candidatus Micrarchaeota archaeon]|nr:hypothetical protein [Candidatus Micrarchaeota archaeon]